ncbi:hypothetical protein LSAT2_029540 [Lamellibrachia satsuma]|nr:hypothetical protein LSAT2_029540 [Lamellibrachia satsuma]
MATNAILNCGLTPNASSIYCHLIPQDGAILWFVYLNTALTPGRWPEHVHKRIWVTRHEDDVWCVNRVNVFVGNR